MILNSWNNLGVEMHEKELKLYFVSTLWMDRVTLKEKDSW